MNLNKFKTTPKSTYFTVRADVLKLASIARVYTERFGLDNLNRSSLVKVIIEHYAELLLANYPEYEFQDMKSAYDYFTQVGIDVNLSGRNIKLLADTNLKASLFSEGEINSVLDAIENKLKEE